MLSSTTTKGLLLIGDGMGDRAVPALGGKTPLEAANTPIMDRCAAEGESGHMDPIAPGIRAGSDTAHLAMLGYDPYQVYPGRGPFECFGIGMEVQPGDLAFRFNFATVDENFTVLDRRAGRITKGTDRLAAAIDGMQVQDVLILAKESVAHRGGMVMRGPGLHTKISEADPHAEGLKVLEVQALSPEAEKTALVCNEVIRRSYDILNDHPINRERVAQSLPPANILLPRGAGFAPNLGLFSDRYGITGACIVEVGLVKGIGRYIGMDVIDVIGSTANVETDTVAIGNAVIEALGRHPFVLCNVKGPDVAGHDCNPQGKIRIIEKIDAMLGQILDGVENLTVAVTGDHCTPVTFGDHTGEPVPILFHGPTVRPDGVQSFGERAATLGSVHRIQGKDVMNIMTSYMGTAEKFGA
ncbi:MAG: 2,3-bisphosphoglycerate-independent phosphoglycerate mutase [Armatimonadetes bacterium]|nr:2,3-bisphosphoglycerate-independent phosphoglycerate mutase [Armatimonadota bacterium]